MGKKASGGLLFVGLSGSWKRLGRRPSRAPSGCSGVAEMGPWLESLTCLRHPDPAFERARSGRGKPLHIPPTSSVPGAAKLAPSLCHPAPQAQFPHNPYCPLLLHHHPSPRCWRWLPTKKAPTPSRSTGPPSAQPEFTQNSLELKRASSIQSSRTPVPWPYCFPQCLPSPPQGQ